MKTMTVGKLKANFSEVLQEVEKGGRVAIAYGRKHIPVAVIVPFHEQAKERSLGVCEGRASYRWAQGDGKMDDNELLRS